VVDSLSLYIKGLEHILKSGESIKLKDNIDINPYAALIEDIDGQVKVGLQQNKHCNIL